MARRITYICWVSNFWFRRGLYDYVTLKETIIELSTLRHKNVLEYDTSNTYSL